MNKQKEPGAQRRCLEAEKQQEGSSLATSNSFSSLSEELGKKIFILGWLKKKKKKENVQKHLYVSYLLELEFKRKK